MRFTKKVFSVLLMSCLFIGLVSMDALNTQAFDEMEVIAGNSTLSHATNMVVKVKLQADLNCSSYVDIYLTNSTMPTTFTANDVNVVLAGGGDADMVLYSSGTDIDTIAFDHSDNGIAPACSTLTAGTVLYFYLGPADSLANNYVTGEPNYFNASAVNTITNSATGSREVIYTNSSVTANKDIKGAYELGYNTVSIGMTNDSFTKLSISTTAVDFGTMDTQSVLTNAIVEITAATNAKNGYVLRVRSTEFTNNEGHNIVALEDGGGSGDPFEVLNGVEGWGINFIANSGTTAGNAGALGTARTDIIGNSYVTDSYNSDDLYYVDVSGNFSEVAISGVNASTGAPGQTKYTMSAVLGTATTTPTGNYTASMVFNVYAKF